MGLITVLMGSFVLGQAAAVPSEAIPSAAVPSEAVPSEADLKLPADAGWSAGFGSTVQPQAGPTPENPVPENERPLLPAIRTPFPNNTEPIPVPDPEPSRADAATEIGRLDPATPRPTPPEMVAEALELPQGSKLTGRPMSLLTAISAAAGLGQYDRQQQLGVVVAYWRLVEAVAAYRFVLEHDRRVTGLQGTAEGAVPLQSARYRSERALSAAMLHETQAAAVTAQHELAAMALLPPDAPLPLPADRPHVGPYRTQFSELFAIRTPPPRTRLIDRILPIRRLAIESRASAVLAAEAEETAAMEAYRLSLRQRGTLGQGDLQAALSAMRRTLRQREAFMAAVCQYNDEVAEYVLAVVGPEVNGEALVRMMITPGEDVLPGDGGRPVAAGEDNRVRPAVYNEPTSSGNTPTPARRPGKNVPTPAKRPEKNVPTLAKRPEKNVPTPAKRPPQEGTTPKGQWSTPEPAAKMESPAHHP